MYEKEILRRRRRGSIECEKKKCCDHVWIICENDHFKPVHGLKKYILSKLYSTCYPDKYLLLNLRRIWTKIISSKDSAGAMAAWKII